MKIYAKHSDDSDRYVLSPRCPVYVRCGVYMTGGIPEFDYDVDEDDDIILLNTDCSGEYDSDGIRYVYAYTYKPEADRKKVALFRNYIKGKYSDMFSKNPDINDFIEAGVLKLDDYVPFDSISAIVNIKPTKTPALVHIIRDYLEEFIDKREFDFNRVKETYDNVSFDAELAREAMRKAGYSESRIDESIDKLLEAFSVLKKTGKLFEMKSFMPRAIRDGFYNFLRFETEEEKEVFRSLQGVNVLIYDDLITSGSTIREVVRYLRAINDKNTLTAFILVKQN